MMAIQKQSFKAVDSLLNKGVSPDKTGEGHSTTPLFLAASMAVASDGEQLEKIAIRLLKMGDLHEQKRRAAQADRRG